MILNKKPGKEIYDSEDGTIRVQPIWNTSAGAIGQLELPRRKIRMSGSGTSMQGEGFTIRKIGEFTCELTGPGIEE